MTSNTQTRGYSFALSFCLVVALSSIFIHEFTQSVYPFLSVFLTFSICTVWFHLVNIKSLRSTYSKLSLDKKNFLFINLATAINWVATFEALKYIDAVLFLSLFMGLIPVITYFIAMLQQTKRLHLKTLLVSLAIASILCAITILSYQSGLFPTKEFQYGVLFTITASITSAIYMIYSKKFEDNTKLSPSHIVGLRFYLLVIATFIICFQKNYFIALNSINYSDFLLLAFLSSIIPLYCLQKSISLIGPIKTSFIIPFTPVFTYLLLLDDRHFTPSCRFPIL